MRDLALVISAMLLCLTNSVVAQLLPAPTLTGPANGATAVTTTPTFSWTPVAGANRYWLMVSTSPSAFPTDPAAISCPVCRDTGLSGLTGSTSHFAPSAFPFGGTPRTLSPGTTYYWKVQGYNTNGAQGAYSEMRSFITASTTQPPSGPGAFSLSLGTPYCDTRPPPGPAVRLDWSTASGSGVTYTVFRNGVQIQTSSLPTSGLSFVNETGLVAGQTYTYQVRASNSGGTRDSNSVSVFIPADICSTPPPPSGPGPFTLSLGNPYCDTRPPPGPAVRLDWSTASGSGVTYTVFRNGVQIQTSSLPTSGLSFINETGLVAVQTYTYQVRASNSGGTRDSNSVSVFIPADVCSTMPPPPPPQGTPNLRPSSVLITPSTGAPGSTALVGFNVANTGNAASRRCQINIRITQPNVIPTTSDLMLVPTFTIDAIPAGSFITVTKSVEIPTGISDGDRSVWVIVDVDRAAGQTAAGEVDDRANTPFRVGSATMAGPNLVPSNFSVTPSSGAAGARPLLNFGVTNSGSVASSPCTAQIRLSSSPTTPADSDPVVGTFSVPSIAAGGGNGVVDRIDIPANASAGLRYLWLRIDANNAAGQAQADRANDLTLASFTITGGPPVPPPPPPTQGAPGAFTLLSPTMGRTNVAHAPLLDWSDAAGAEHYIVTIDDSADFRSPLPSIRVAASESQYQFPNAALSRGKRYTWKVDAVSAGGMMRATPATSSFVVTSSAAPPPPPPPAEMVTLQNAVVRQIGSMAKNEKRHFRLTVPPTAVGLSVTTAGAVNGNVDLYIQRGQPAGMTSGQFITSSQNSASDERVVIGDGLTSEDYFVMVFAKKASNGVSIVADHSDDPAGRKGTLPKPVGVSNEHDLLPQIEVELRRADNPGPNSVILRNAKTWLVIHGRESSPGIPPPRMSGFHTNNIGRVVQALSAGLSSERGAQQVLVLDWSQGATDNQWFASLDSPAIGPPSAALGGFEGSYWIPSVAAWAAQQLNDLGISGENLHIVGHSWGTYVACELSNHMRVLPSSLGKPGSVIALDPARLMPGTHYSGAGAASLGIDSFPRSAAFKTSFALSNHELVKSARWSIDTRIDAPGLDVRLQTDQHGNGVEMLAGMLERLNGTGVPTQLDKLLDPYKMIDQRQPVPSRKKGWSFLDDGRSINGYDALLCARFVTDATGAEDDRGADQWQPETLYTCMAASPSACVDRATPRLFGVLSCLSDEAASGIFPPDAGTIRTFNRTSLLRVGTDRLGLVDARFNVAVYQFNSGRATSRVKISLKVVDGVRRDDLHVALCDPSPVNVVGYARLLQKTTNADGELQQVFAVDSNKDYYPVVYSDGECATRFSIRVELIP